MICAGCDAERIGREITVLGTVLRITTACPCGYADAVDLRRREALMRSLAERVRLLSSVPHRYADATFEGVAAPVRRKLEAALGRLPDLRSQIDATGLADSLGRVVVRGRGLALFGGNGPGKTTAMAAFLGAARERLIVGVLIPATQLQGEIETGMRFGSPEPAAAVVRRYAGVPLLVIDDVDKIIADVSTARYLYELVDARWREDRPLYLTSNARPERIAEVVFGQRFEGHADGVADRWAAMSEWVAYDGPSRRPAAARQGATA